MEKINQKLWEILVPVFEIIDPVGEKYNVEWSVEYHHEWDQYVREIAGGLTINKRARGIWTSPETGKIFQEKMIPVRIFCTLEKIEEIADFTIKHYKQKAIMFYLISDTIFIKYKDE